MNEKYHLVNTQEKLQQFLPKFNQAPAIAVDVEFDNKYSYDVIICLIQLSTGSTTILVDPLLVDVSPLTSLFEDDQKIKIFFSGIQDIQLLQSQYGWQIKSIVDVSTIYQVVNDDDNQTSLNDVIDDILGVDIPKNKQIQSREDWKQRPPPVEMQLYAARDVFYLHKILIKLQKRLIPEDQQLLEVYFLQVPLIANQTENSLMYAFDLCHRYRVRDERDRYLIFRLIQFREKIAEMTEQSSGYIISKSELKKLVSSKPTSVHDLKNASLYSGNIKKYSHDILEIIRDIVSKNQEPSDYYKSLEETYNKYYPHTKYLDRQYNWPYEISISSYRNRRGMLRILRSMIEDRVNDDDLNYIYTRYLNHQLALHEDYSLLDLRRRIEACKTRDDVIDAIYSTTLEIYKLIDN